MARHNAVGAVDQNGIDKTKFGDAGGNLFDLPGTVRAGIFDARFKFARVLVFDGQRLHSVPRARRLRDCAAYESRIRNIGNLPISFDALPISARCFPIYFST